MPRVGSPASVLGLGILGRGLGGARIVPDHLDDLVTVEYQGQLTALRLCVAGL